MISGIWSSWGTTIDCAIMPKPIATAARFVRSTAGAAVVRRSTRGSSWRSSKAPHASRTRMPATIAVHVRPPSQPHVLPLETPTRKLDRPIARPTVPATSSRPDEPSCTCGTATQVRTVITAARAAATQNNACQSPESAIQAASGRPIAPPTPRVALIVATPVEAISGGANSRMNEMPTGMKPIARPCRARPASMGASESDSAHTVEPTSSSAALAVSTRCLPTMSAIRPATGMVTAAASNVMVMTHDAFEADVDRSPGSSLWIGMTIVWVRAALRPPAHRTPMASPGRAARGGRGAHVCNIHMLFRTTNSARGPPSSPSAPDGASRPGMRGAGGARSGTTSSSLIGCRRT